jgi:hypothetical protein
LHHAATHRSAARRGAQLLFAPHRTVVSPAHFNHAGASLRITTPRSSSRRIAARRIAPSLQPERNSVMRIVTAHLRSVAPYSQSRPYDPEWQDGDTHDSVEQRTWREKCHCNSDGFVFIPPMAYIWSIQYAASRMGRKIEGSRNKTWTKTFQSGIMCIDPLVLPIKKDQVRGEKLYVNADGVRGSGKRVWKTFPIIDKWEGRVPFHILADDIPRDLFEETVTYAGMLAGIGRFRPEKGGYLGRFEAKKFDWE